MLAMTMTDHDAITADMLFDGDRPPPEAENNNEAGLSSESKAEPWQSV